MITANSVQFDRSALNQSRHEHFQIAFTAWQSARRNTENWVGDDMGTERLFSDEATAVDTLMATPAPNIAGVITKLDSMWSSGGEWRNDLRHRQQIVTDLQSFEHNFSDVSVEL